MHAAPAVALRCTGGQLWCTLHVGLPALAAAAGVAWAVLLIKGLAPEMAVLPLAVLAAALVAGFVFWRGRPPAVALQWDGQRWSADGQAGQLQLMMDPGFLLVLRLHRDGGSARWLAVSAAEAGPAWHALRAAVYSRPPRATPRALAPERVAD